MNLQQAANIVNYDLPWNPMRLVQRHGRILQRKIKQAAAAVGVGHILPGMDPVDRTITETRELIEQIRAEEAALFDDGGSAALSGEEYRRRLADALKATPTKARVLGLPWGAGTGLERPGADPGFVFCARVADWSKPSFRYVTLNPDLTVGLVNTGDVDEAGNPIKAPNIVRDTLAALSAADPRRADAPAVEVPAAMLDAAFDAWALAKEDILRDWQTHTDPANLTPPLAKTMRDAATFVETHGSALGDKQDELAARLRGQYPTRIQRAVRAAMNPTTPKSLGDVVKDIAQVADDYGLVIPEPPTPRPWAGPDDIHLVCWTAINPTNGVVVDGVLPGAATDELF